mgnify:CR=1 FL=1
MSSCDDAKGVACECTRRVLTTEFSTWQFPTLWPGKFHVVRISCVSHHNTRALSFAMSSDQELILNYCSD